MTEEQINAIAEKHAGAFRRQEHRCVGEALRAAIRETAALYEDAVATCLAVQSEPYITPETYEMATKALLTVQGKGEGATAQALRDAIIKLYKTRVYEDGEMAKGISVEFLAALHDAAELAKS